MTFRTLLHTFLDEVRAGPGSLGPFICLVLLGSGAGVLIGGLLGTLIAVLAFCASFVFWNAMPRPLAEAVSDAAKVAASAVLVSFVLGFLSIMTVFAAGLAAFAIMTGSGFDFDAVGNDPVAFERAMEAYQLTPGWQLSMVVFAVAMLILAIGAARALPVFAGAAEERRIVALEGFNWSRKQGAKILLVAIIALLPSGLAIAAGILQGQGIAAVSLAIVGLMLGHYALCALSSATYTVFAPQSVK